MHKFLMLAALLAMAVPIVSLAVPPAYTYAEAGFSKATTSGFSGGKGYMLGGSYAWANHWYVAGSYRSNNFDGGVLTGGFFTRDEVIELGGHLALTDSMDLVGRVGYANDRWKQGPSTNLFPGFVVSTDDIHDGYDFGVGIRAMLTDALELDAFLDHDDVGLLSHDHRSAETVGSVAALYQFTDHFALGLSYARGNEKSASNWMLTGRWYFLSNQ